MIMGTDNTVALIEIKDNDIIILKTYNNVLMGN
jgi:hypothetical protein